MKRSDLRIHPTVCFAFGCLLALLTGCTKPETDIGLGLQPASELLDAVTVDTVTVRMVTVLEDSLQMPFLRLLNTIQLHLLMIQKN